VNPRSTLNAVTPEVTDKLINTALGLAEDDDTGAIIVLLQDLNQTRHKLSELVLTFCTSHGPHRK
jgi:hypothetical protein